MSEPKPRSAVPTTSRMIVKQKILPLPLTWTQLSFSLAQSPHTGRGGKTQVLQLPHFCMTSLPALAPSQNGWLTGVISGRGFLATFSSAMWISCVMRERIIHHEDHEA